MSERLNAAGERSRQRIVTAAAEAFRRQGLDGIGVRDLMKQAGMTQGSFYFHFRDKNALAVEASREAFAATTEWLFRAVDSAPAGQKLPTLIDHYLSAGHRGSIGSGCTMAALGAEFARGDAALRREFAEASEQMVERTAACFKGRQVESRRRKARLLLASMAGVMTAARVLADRAASDALMADARAFFKASVRDQQSA